MQGSCSRPQGVLGQTLHRHQQSCLTWKAKYLRTTPNSTSDSEIILWIFLFMSFKMVGSSAKKMVSTIPGRMAVMRLLKMLTCRAQPILRQLQKRLVPGKLRLGEDMSSSTQIGQAGMPATANRSQDLSAGKCISYTKCGTAYVYIRQHQCGINRILTVSSPQDTNRFELTCVEQGSLCPQ